MKVLGVSDTHLAETIWANEPIYGDSKFAWFSVIEIAKREGVDTVILAGDVLNKQANMAATIGWLAAGINELVEAGISLKYIQGQHEYQVNPWIAALDRSDKSVEWIHGKTVKMGKYKVLGCDYTPKAKFQEFLKSEEVAQADFLVCHQVWKEFMGNVGDPQASFDDIPSNIKYMLTGDYHDHILHKHENGLWVFSPGSTHIREISEPENKEVFVLDMDKYPIKVTNVPLPSRRVLNLTTKVHQTFRGIMDKTLAWLETAEDYAKEHELPELLRKPVIRLKHYPQDNEIALQFKKEFQDRAHLFFAVMATTTGESELTEDKKSGKQERFHATDLLHRYKGLEEKPKVKDLASQLLSNAGKAETKQVLSRWLEAEDADSED